MGVSVDVTGVYSGLEKFNLLARNRVRNYFEDSAEELESYMKENAPWHDRTGNARRGLSADVSENINAIRIELSHSVDYGIFLEYAMEERFAILEPTARLKGPDVINGMKGLLNR
jgi:hypothetical protein